jgi:hypothetical protein
MRKCVNHVLGINCKLSVDKLNSMIRNGFRVSPADYPWPSMADPRTIGKWVAGATARDVGTRGSGDLGTWKAGDLRGDVTGAGRECTPLRRSCPGRGGRGRSMGAAMGRDPASRCGREGRRMAGPPRGAGHERLGCDGRESVVRIAMPMDAGVP